MRLLRKEMIRILGIVVIGVWGMMPSLYASDERVAAELAAPSPVNPLKSALGEQAYNDAMASGNYQYVGNTKCRLCHREFFLGRKTDHHDFSMESLAKGSYQENPACLACHATGFGVPTGFLSIKDTPRLANIQCEGCHGPGNIHIDQAKEQMRSKKKEPVHGFLAGKDNPARIKKMCIACHTERWNRSFEDLESAYNKYRKAVPR